MDFGKFGSALNPCDDPPVGLGGTQTMPTSKGGAFRSQNTGLGGYGRAAYGGKILRIDPVTGDAAPGNPLSGSAVPRADRLPAAGFRNPLRFPIPPGP